MGYILVQYMITRNGIKKPDFYYGGNNKKYPDMINVAIKDTAKVFEDFNDAKQKADRLNSYGWRFDVVEDTKNPKIDLIRNLPNEFDFLSDINNMNITYHAAKQKHNYLITWNDGTDITKISMAVKDVRRKIFDGDFIPI